MGVCRKVGMAQANPTIPPPPLVLTRQASLPEHCFAPAPHIFVILKATPIPPHKFFKNFQKTSCLTLYNTYNAPVPQENRVSAGRYQCIECNAPQHCFMCAWGTTPTPIKKAPGIAPGVGRWGSPTEEKANEQSGNCLHTHSVLVYITHISFTTPSCSGQ